MPITRPQDLDIPEKMQEVMADLNREGQSQFTAELLHALKDAERTNDLGPVQYVVNAWYVSRRFLTHPEIETAIEVSLDLEGSHIYHTSEELAARLGVA